MVSLEMVHGIEVPTTVRHDNTLRKPLREYGGDDPVDIVVTNPPFGGMEEDGIERGFPTEFQTRETADLFLVLVMELLKAAANQVDEARLALKTALQVCLEKSAG